MTVEFPPNTSIGRNALAVLASLPLFEDLEPGALVAVAEELEWFCLPGGTILFKQGDEADSLYAVTSGSLGAFRNDGDGKTTLIGRIQRGETLGEGALLSGGVRTATVKSIRDTELVRFSKEAFEKLVLQYPSAMLHIARVTVARMEQTLRRDSPPIVSRSFAILGNGPGVDADGFARSLVKVLAKFGKTELFTSDLGEQHTSAWFNEVESRRDFVVFVADERSTPWTRQCIGQADSLILLADAKDEPRPWANLDFADVARSESQRTELVLLHQRWVRPGLAARWLKQYPAAQHHHIVSEDDFRRFARILTGRAVGLVLSGGGARGFAHIGVIKALCEAGIPIDICGGTSIGSIIASGLAAGWDNEQMVERYRRTFVDRNPLGDYTLPFMSISSGRRVSRLLRGEVGNIDVVDLPLPYFCVSADLVTSSMVVHRSGLLWRCLRASVAIPGVLPPVFHSQQILVDGGVVNHLPVDVMRGLGRGPVIGVDVGSESSLASCDEVDEMSVLARWNLLRNRKAPNIVQLLLRAGSLSTTLVTAANREQSSILLKPPLQGIDILDWRAFDRAIEAGYRSTMQRMEEIQAALKGDRHRFSV
ncbi:MAG: patatin-like phospholipase family protein [Proteobacteria bacterium]|nr:patatin-like phospholipase family protein [Pseudomonadota bacterium]